MTLRPRAHLYVAAALVILGLGAGLVAHAQGRAGKRGARRPAPLPAAEEERATPHVEDGLRLSEAGDWEGAIKAFRQAVAVSPRHPEAHVLLGDAYMSAGRYEDAFAAYRQAVHVAPRNPDAHYSLGAAYNDMAQYGDAFKHFVQAIQLDPSYAEAYYGIGYAYQKLDNFKEALGFLRSALRLRPDYPEARLSLGLTYAGLGDFKAAEEQLRQLEASDAPLAKTLRGELQRAAADASAQGDLSRELPTPPAAAAQKPKPTPAVEKQTAADKQSAAEKQSAPPAPARRQTTAGAEAGRAGNDAARPAAGPFAVELAFWDSVKNSTDPEEFAAYLKRFPDGQFSDLARIRQRALAGRTNEPKAEARPETEIKRDDTKPAAVVVDTLSLAASQDSASAPANDAAPTTEPLNAAPTSSPTPPADAAPAPSPSTPAAASAADVVKPVEPARPLTLEETLEWLRQNFSNSFAYRYSMRGAGGAAAAPAYEASVSYEPVLFQGCKLEWRDAGDTLSVSLSELDPQGLRVEPRSEPNTVFASEVWNVVLASTGGARAFREVKGDGSGATNSYHAVTLQFDNRERAERLADKLRHAVRLCGGKSAPL